MAVPASLPVDLGTPLLVHSAQRLCFFSRSLSGCDNVRLCLIAHFPYCSILGAPGILMEVALSL